MSAHLSAAQMIPKELNSSSNVYLHDKVFLEIKRDVKDKKVAMSESLCFPKRTDP